MLSQEIRGGHRCLETRQGDISDVGWPVYLRAAARWERMGPAMSLADRATATGEGQEQAVSYALVALRELGLAR